jgi:hypothetical protein
MGAPATEAEPCTWGDPIGAESRRSSCARTATFTSAARRVRLSRAAIAESHPLAPALLRASLRQPCPPAHVLHFGLKRRKWRLNFLAPSVGLLAIAEVLVAAPRPKRSVILVWDSGEERGLSGTRHFVHAPPVPLEDIVAHFDMDMIGGTRPAGTPESPLFELTGPNEVYLIGPGALSPSADALLDGVNRDYLAMHFMRRQDTPESEFFSARTDAGPYLERGILAIGFFTGLHERYHRPSDETRYLDPEKIRAGTGAALASIWVIAGASQRPRIELPIPETVPRHR